MCLVIIVFTFVQSLNSTGGLINQYAITKIHDKAQLWYSYEIDSRRYIARVKQSYKRFIKTFITLHIIRRSTDWDSTKLDTTLKDTARKIFQYRTRSDSKTSLWSSNYETNLLHKFSPASISVSIQSFQLDTQTSMTFRRPCFKTTRRNWRKPVSDIYQPDNASSKLPVDHVKM